ncbi:hypothetical protein TcYC6_0101390 [Trypanosoma cruzi]|nr:hypothetical protein TcYC6_0101390 [Trypanosoma cruzi]
MMRRVLNYFLHTQFFGLLLLLFFLFVSVGFTLLLHIIATTNKHAHTQTQFCCRVLLSFPPLQQAVTAATMGAAPIITGRCFWGRRTTPNGPLVYTAVGSQKGSDDRRRTPISFIGNTYYERRFGGSRSTQSTPLGTSLALPSLRNGDILVKMGSATPASLRGRRIVDVTGIQTSFFDASERNARARCCIDDVVHSMHMHDGHEVPELNRGTVDIGRLTVLCAFPVAGTASLLVLENASQALLKRRSLGYRSEEEGVQLVRVIAESCRAAALRRICLHPVMRNDCIVGVRL